MSGAATLTRPIAPPAPRVAPLAGPTRVGALRVALVLSMWAGALAAVGVSRSLTSSFGGTVRTLGSANPYVDEAATLLGWLLAVAGLVLATTAARRVGASAPARAAVAVSVGGAALLAAGAACALWAVAIASSPTHSKGWLSNATKVLATTREVVTLSKVSAILAAAGLVALAAACGIGAQRASVSPSGAARMRVLLALGGAFVLMAVGQATTLAFLWSGSVPGQAGVLVAYASTTLGWLLVALAIALLPGALRGPRTSALIVGVPIGVIGALSLGAWSGTVLTYAWLRVTGAGAGSYATLSKIGSATQWAGWLALALAVGVVATRVTAIKLSLPRVPTAPRR